MSLVGLLLTLVIFGFVGWLITLIPMNPTIRLAIVGVLILGLVLYILQGFNLIPHVMNLR